MEPVTRGGAAATTMRPVLREQLEAFHAAEYPKPVKILMIFGAQVEEAEDAAQKAMMDFARRSKAGRAPDRNPAAYVLQAAVRFFIKERQRERERLPRELRAVRLTPQGHLDDQLTAWEDDQYVEHLLECLTVTQPEVLKRVINGMPTREIAAQLGKTEATIRQHLKQGRDRLQQHPEIAPLAPNQGRAPAVPGKSDRRPQRRNRGRRRSSERRRQAPGHGAAE